MERPGINGALATLPRFGRVMFGNVLVCTKGNKSYEASQGVAVDMTSNGQTNGTRYASGSADTVWDSKWVASS